MTEPRYPDVEIYLKKPDPGAVWQWLESRFGTVDVPPGVHGLGAGPDEKDPVTCFLGPDRIACLITPDAARGGYVSLWFKSDRTPWQSDRECAREAFSQLAVEVRCSLNSWQESDGDLHKTGDWLRITAQGESEVAWNT